MCRWLVRLQIGLAAVLALLTGLVLSLAYSGTPSRSPVRREAFCDLPCWRGIHPGETLIAQANRILMAQGYSAENNVGRIHYTPPEDSRDCQVSLEHENALVMEIRLSHCPDLQLGDTLAALGQPDRLSPNLLTLGFDAGAVRLQLHSLDCGENLSPYTDVQSISLSEHQQVASDATAPPWQGFALPWRYLRSIPDIVVLAC